MDRSMDNFYKNAQNVSAIFEFLPTLTSFDIHSDNEWPTDKHTHS